MHGKSMSYHYQRTACAHPPWERGRKRVGAKLKKVENQITTKNLIYHIQRPACMYVRLVRKTGGNEKLFLLTCFPVLIFIDAGQRQ